MNWFKRIGNKADHNAFVDLCEGNQQLFCCYREAQNHISADGTIRILTLDLDGNILLIAYARLTSINNQTISAQNLSWISQTGHSWSAAKQFADKGSWLWRVKWHKSQAYGFAYNRRQNAIHL